MSATASITPTSWNQIAVDYWSPKTAAGLIYVRPSESGTDYAAFDGANTQFKCNKIVPYSGSEIDHSSNKLIIGSATAYNHAVRASQVGSGELLYVISAGTQPTYTMTLTTPITGYVTGMRVYVKCHSSFASGTATININAVGAKNIVKAFGSTVGISVGEFNSGGYYTLVYDGTSFAIENRNYRVSGTTPTITGFGSMSISATSYDYCITTQVEGGMDIDAHVTFTTGGTPSSILYLTGLAINADASIPSALTVNLWTGGGYEGAMAVAVSNYIEVRLLSGTISNGTLRAVTLSGTYRLP
jgi:hypothetical protein